MTITPRATQAVLTAAYLSVPCQVFGPEGGRALRLLLDAIGLIYEEFPPDALSNGITVIAPSNPDDLEAILAPLGVSSYHADAASVANVLRTNSGRSVTIGVAADSSYRLIVTDGTPSLSGLAVAAVVYNHDGCVERLLAGTENRTIQRLAPELASNLAKPTFRSLDDALDHYDRIARHSQCDTLALAWEGGVDGPRLVLSARPERHMQSSLHRALSYMLRHADVTREHSTDASKPVDIRVKWRSSNVEAILEIKWLGRSLTADSTESDQSFTDYRPSRAQEGAKQLADYLEREKSNSGANALKGYLIVFDARRRGIKGPADRLAAADALYFQDVCLSFNPDYSAERDDFETPRRYFMAPRSDHFQEQQRSLRKAGGAQSCSAI